jgi:hypothetical protein
MITAKKQKRQQLDATTTVSWTSRQASPGARAPQGTSVRTTPQTSTWTSRAASTYPDLDLGFDAFDF